MRPIPWEDSWRSMFIYKIVNNINGKIYVGKTNNPTERKSTHFREYLKDETKLLYKAMRKYGSSNFEFIIIEECEDSIWEEREKYWIAYYESLTDKGYNMIDGGTEPPHFVGEDHPLAKLSWSSVNEIKTLLIDDNILMKEIASRYNISIDQIYRINTGESWSKSNEKYPLRKKNRLEQEELDAIIWYLQNTQITQKDIGKLFNRTRTAITAINNGANYFDSSINYPIRKGRNYKHE